MSEDPHDRWDGLFLAMWREWQESPHMEDVLAALCRHLERIGEKPVADMLRLGVTPCREHPVTCYRPRGRTDREFYGGVIRPRREP